MQQTLSKSSMSGFARRLRFTDLISFCCRVCFSIGAPAGQVEVFIKCLEEAARVVKSLILAT